MFNWHVKILLNLYFHLFSIENNLNQYFTENLQYETNAEFAQISLISTPLITTLPLQPTLTLSTMYHIAVAALGSVVFLLLFGVVFCWVLKKRKVK